MSAIAIKNMTKTYPKTGHRALIDITFKVRNGEIFGLVGPDGAGKTSLLRILATTLLPDEGTVLLHDVDAVQNYQKIREMIGYMPGRFSLYSDLTVAENLSFFATLYGVKVRENYHLIGDIYSQLEPFRHRRAGKLSGGMKQKLALCCALIHRPRILLLDEPTTGVDPVSRREFWQILQELKEHEITILVSTPYMDEAERCDRIALIQNGRILMIDSPNGITDQFPKVLYGLWGDDIRRILPVLAHHPKIEKCYSFGDQIHLTFTNTEYRSGDLIRELENQHFTGLRISPIPPTIEDCFIELMHAND